MGKPENSVQFLDKSVPIKKSIGSGKSSRSVSKTEIAIGKILVWFQVVLSVLESSKKWQDPLTIFYEEQHDILLWSEFLSRRKSSQILSPSFLKLPRTEKEMMRVLVNLKHQGSSHNVILFAANVGLASQFLSSCQTSGVLSEQTNLLITTLVRFFYQFSFQRKILLCKKIM